MTLVYPHWQAAGTVHAFVTTRAQGNLGVHVGDREDALENRRRLVVAAGLPYEPLWLAQVHGSTVVTPGEEEMRPPRADAAYTRDSGVPLAVMVADCLPILLSSRDGEEIGVAHAGWRGLADGVIEALLEKFQSEDILAWLGPAIGPCHYEVDHLVREAFTDDAGFQPGRDAEHWMMDLWAVARHRLSRLGVKTVYGGGSCTWCDPRFFSHRQGGKHAEGRIAAIIWKA